MGTSNDLALSPAVRPAHKVRSRSAGDSPFSRRALALLFLGALTEMALLALWQRNGYWDFSDGVYAESAREVLRGIAPYRGFAAAQPPPVYLVGALLLAVENGLAAVRAGMALCDLATALLVGVCTWRLSGRRWLAVLSAGVAPLLPISLHEHAQLTPETLAAPLLIGGALCCARERTVRAGGLLLALAAACKVAFFVPALAIALAAGQRRKAIASLLVAGTALGLVSLAAFGGALWRQVVVAQLQVGAASLHYVAGLLAQAAWSELPLLAGALLAVWMIRRGHVRERDPALRRTLVAAAAGGLLLALTVFKQGSYLNVLVVCEPPLLVLAACGGAWAWTCRPRLRPLCLACAALLAGQSVSLLLSPANPWLAVRPGARSGLAWNQSPAAISVAVEAARRCPRRVAYSGSPYVAFLAGRPMPGRQPDLFMIQHAPIDAGFRTRADSDLTRCP